MDKSAFKPDTRYTVTWRDPQGTLRPANFYVYRVYDHFMIARLTGGDGLLRKVSFGEVVKIVREQPVPAQERFIIPAPVLEEQTWRERSEMQLYASSPQLGK